MKEIRIKVPSDVHKTLKSQVDSTSLSVFLEALAGYIREDKSSSLDIGVVLTIYKALREEFVRPELAVGNLFADCSAQHEYLESRLSGPGTSLLSGADEALLQKLVNKTHKGGLALLEHLYSVDSPDEGETVH